MKTMNQQRQEEMSLQIKNRVCPFVKKPFNACYCFNLTSSNINPAINYCGNNFEACDIYINNYSHGYEYKSKSEKK
jgi:hypothetical protein